MEKKNTFVQFASLLFPRLKEIIHTLEVGLNLSSEGKRVSGGGLGKKAVVDD